MRLRHEPHFNPFRVLVARQRKPLALLSHKNSNFISFCKIYNNFFHYFFDSN